MTDPAPAEFAIETRGLWKRFGDQPAVRDLSLKVRTGSTFGFIGLNGAGKSTTIRMLMGLLKPSAGEVRLRGWPLAADRVISMVGVGYVPDRPNVYPWMRIEEAIAFCRSLRRTWNERLCADLLNRFELEPRQRVKRLSKGQAAKLSLLLAVSHDPDILILDEPMDGLDPLARDEFLSGVLEAVCGRNAPCSSPATRSPMSSASPTRWASSTRAGSWFSARWPSL
jgi:ABC-2 type transport system ATP-binding protein